MADGFRNPESPAFRYNLLAWNVFIGLGTTFCTDLPSPLQARFTGTSVACSKANESSTSILTNDCFNATYDEYNSLYASYSWANAAFTVFGGIISDKMGCHNSILVWCGVHVLGSMLFAFGSLRLFSTFFIQLLFMNAGRVLLGIANGSIQTNQSQFNTFWFHAHALSLAFGIKVFVARVGSTLNFFLTANLVNWIGLSWTLIFGVGMSISSFIAAIVVSRLHMFGLRELGVVDDVVMASKLFKLKHLRTFSLSFYTLVAMLSFFYCGVLAFISDATEFMRQRYAISEHAASYITSGIYSFSLFNPFVSLLVDRWGQRGWWLLVSCALSSLGYVLIWIFPMMPPLLFISFIAVGYTCFASNVWASIPLLVPFELSGSAFGIAGSLQMFFVGICNIIVGRILATTHDPSGADDLKWQYMLYFLGATAICSLVLAALLLLADYRGGHRLKPTQKQLQQALLDGSFDETDVIQPSSSNADDDDAENDDIMPAPRYEAAAASSRVRDDERPLIEIGHRRASLLDTLPPPIAAHSNALMVPTTAATGSGTGTNLAGAGVVDADGQPVQRQTSLTNLVSPAESVLAEMQHNVPN